MSESLIGKKFDVGIGSGFIRVVSLFNDEQMIVDAARISYQKGTKRIRDDRNLIRYLMRHKHTSPFEMCEILVHIRAPMDVWRQWVRHRTASINEYSTRYSEAIDDRLETDPTSWRLQSTTNKQGSSGYLALEEGALLSARESEFHRIAQAVYEERIKLGVAREQARKDLPLSTYTEAYWKIDLHNLLHFLKLRMDSHAQFEIRQYAKVLGYQIVKEWVPTVWEAFVDYQLQSYTLSRMEKLLVRMLLERSIHTPNTLSVEQTTEFIKSLCESSGIELTQREINEFVERLTR